MRLPLSFLLLSSIAIFASACTTPPEASNLNQRDEATPGPATAEATAQQNQTPATEATAEPLAEEVLPVIEPTATRVLDPTASPTIIEATIPDNPVVKIPLAGPVANRRAQLSGLTWYQDYLIILPQFPDFDGGAGDGFVYALAKTDITSYLDGQLSGPLEPTPIPPCGSWP